MYGLHRIHRALGATVLGTIIAAAMPVTPVFAGEVPGATVPKALKVNVNTATQKELEELPGVGPETAKKIIEGRPYRHAGELKKAGIGEARLEALKPHLWFETVDVNTATQKELEALPIIGPAMAKKIVANRPYKNAEELSKAGLNEKKIEEVAPMLLFPPAAPVATAAPAAPVAPAVAAPPAVPAPGAAAAQVAKAMPAPTTAPSAVPAAASLKGKTIDLNTGTIQELEAIPGVDAAEAKKIIAARPYKSPADLSKVGFSEKRISEIASRLTVDAPATVSPATVTGSAKKIDINTATINELKEIPGVDAAEAAKIIAGRPYKTPEDLKKIGFGEQRISEISPRLTFDIPKAADKK